MIGTILGIVALIVVIVAGSLIWRYTRRERTTLSSDGFLSLDGYQSMDLVGDTCCLVDGSGVVYSLNLATGKQEYLFRGPADLSWVADPTLETIYYFDKQILYEKDTATGGVRQVLDLTDPDDVWAEDSRSLYLNYGMIRTRKVLAVTDHYVLYLARHAEQDDQYEGVYLESCDFYAMDRETLDTRLILSGDEGYFQFGSRIAGGHDFLVRGDMLYTIRYDTRSDKQENAYLTALDLTTGAFNDLVTLNGDVLFLSATADRLLYVYAGSYNLYQVPLIGGEPTVLTRLPIIERQYDNYMLNGLSEDGTLFGISNYTVDDKSILYRLNTDTGEYEELHRFTGFMGLHTLVTDGTYYGVIGWTDGKKQVFLGKLQ